MKIEANTKHRTIDIVVDFVPMEEVSSETHVEYRPNLTPEQQYTEEQLIWYNDLIDNVLNALEDYAGFNIIDDYQSDDSYSYYIEFEAFTSEGQSLGNFTVKIRIADHLEPRKRRALNRPANSRTAEEVAKNSANKKSKIFRSIKINEVSQSGLVAVMQTIWRVCDELLAGNVSVLDELGR